MMYAKLIFLPFFILFNTSISERNSVEVNLSAIQEDLPYLLPFYKRLHQMPEVSLHEKETSALLASLNRYVAILKFYLFTINIYFGNLREILVRYA